MKTLLQSDRYASRHIVEDETWDVAHGSLRLSMMRELAWEEEKIYHENTALRIRVADLERQLAAYIDAVNGPDV